ncbi:hypothetical protein BDZ45DRAFT_678924 [Acephala macrosclerotiorum]|nr:hypothetical protein BDZ45DRAFT_678924 [Acephala macrosclerotiorum]
MDAKIDIRSLSFQPTTILERAAMYCLSDFVEDKLASEKASTAQRTARQLLTYLCSFHVIASQELPLPTEKMVKALLQISGFPRDLLLGGGAKADSMRPPGISGTVDQSTESVSINPLSISPLLENRLSLIGVFLKAGVDPFHNLSFIPLDFVLQKKLVQASVKSALGNAATPGAGLSRILWALQRTFE